MDDKIDDDDVPWASPEIRREYVAALGAFMLEYNQLDHLLTSVLDKILIRLGRQDLVDDNNAIYKKDFATKVHVLDLLKSIPGECGIASIPVHDLRQLGQDRAVLAHGHMDQNPVDGSYRLMVKGRNKGTSFTVKRISGLTAKARQLWSALQHAEAFYWFDTVEPSSIEKISSDKS